ncbi:MAG TPA: hypothetical protein VG960_00760 [Caulobacteraceae bacterium]|nr:hypothetical protein [Caulobacteraceae bacterium]
MNLAVRVLVGLLGVVACAAAPAMTAAQDAKPVLNRAPTAKDWTTISKLPDWSGVWLPDHPDPKEMARRTKANPAPWTEKAAARIAKQEAARNAGHPDNIFANCLPQGMPSWVMISNNAMEIAFTPGKIYILGESDGNRLRRIYTDGRPHPADPDPTFFGHSIGHWEGDTLVVDTVGIAPQVFLAIGEATGVPNNGDMHVVERIRLTAPDVLTDTMVITAPHVLTKPWTTSRLFNRTRRRDYDIVEGVCLQGAFNEDVDQNGDSVFTPQVMRDDGIRAPLK